MVVEPTRERVLVVDDDDGVRELVEMVLSERGFDVATAENGRRALDYMNSEDQVRVILLDMRMPVMDGWEFASRYRQSMDAKARIIVFTAAHDAAQRAAQVAADGYISKPFDLETLVYTVSAHFGAA